MILQTRDLIIQGLVKRNLIVDQHYIIVLDFVIFILATFEIVNVFLSHRVREDVVHSIRCHALKDSPTEPRSYIEHMEESEADRLGFREVIYSFGKLVESSDTLLT